MKIESKIMTKELENYEPKGQLIGFPKEVIARMLHYQEEQSNKRDVTVFEEDKFSFLGVDGFDWDKTKEKFEFWNEVIKEKNFDLFFEQYPKKDHDEPKTAKYVQVGDNAILSDYTSTESSVEINTTEDNSQEFKVGDKVIDIISGRIGKVTYIAALNMDSHPITVNFNDEGLYFTLNGRYYDTDKHPRLLHYRDDYNYDVIDFNNLPKRQESKRWRAEEGGCYYFVSFNERCWFYSSDTIDTYASFDNSNYNSGNYFSTEVEAEIIAQKMNTYFKQLIQEEHEHERI